MSLKMVQTELVLIRFSYFITRNGNKIFFFIFHLFFKIQKVISFFWKNKLNEFLKSIYYT